MVHVPTAFDAVIAAHELVEQALAAPNREVTLADARAFLWWAGDKKLGIDPGRFIIRLIPVLFAADEENLARLRGLFPGLVAAVEMYRNEIDWIGHLQGIVREVAA